MSNYEIRPAVGADVDAVVALYGQVCDALAAGTNYSGWSREDYPTRTTAENWLASGMLYVLLEDGQIAATVALTHQPEPGYVQGAWTATTSAEEAFIIHTLATHPQGRGKGYAGALLEFAKEEGRRQGMKALWLDVSDYNGPAMALYQKTGFQRVASLDLFGTPAPYELYYLYEYVL